MSAASALLSALDALGAPGQGARPPALEARGWALLRQMGDRTRLSRKQAWEHSAVLRLLCARGALPREMDSLLRVWLERVAAPPGLLQASAALLEVLELLPLHRARPLVGAWMERVASLERERHHRLLPSRGRCWALIPARAASWLQARLQEEAAQRQPDVSMLLFWLHSLRGVSSAPEPPSEADLWLGVVLRAAAPGALQRRDLELLAWWPRGRLEPLLLEAPQVPWRWVEACPSGAMARRVVSAVVDMPRDSPVPSYLVEQALDALGELVRGPLSQALQGEAGQQRGLLLEAAARQPGPWAVGALAARLSDGHSRHRELAGAALASLGSPEALEEVCQVARGGPARGQREAALALLRWPRPEAAQEAAARLLPEVKDTAARRTLAQVARRAEDEGVADQATLEHWLAQAPAPTAEEIRHIQLAWMRADHWTPRLCGDRAAVLRFYLMLEQCKSNYMPELHEIWFQALRDLGQDDLVPALAVKALDVFTVDTEHYLEAVAPFLGRRLEPALVAALVSGRHPRRRVLYRWLCEHGAAPLELHRAMLMDSAAMVRRRAAQAMAEALGQADDFLFKLLKADRAQQRQSAAEVLARLKDPGALAAIQEALEVERAKGARAALEEARRACDPVLSGVEVSRSISFGAYRAGQPLELRAGLEQLRSVMHDADPAPWTWARLCNLLDRFRDQGQLKLALDYVLAHGLERWPQSGRVRPSDWGQVPALAALDLQPPAALMVTAQALLGPRRPEVMSSLVRPLQERLLSYRLEERQLEDFARAAAWAWGWCQEQGLTPDRLELRVDEGTHNTSHRQPRVALHLIDGFFVQIAPAPARSGRVDPGPGVRLLRVKPPRGHHVRERFDMNSRARYLDLRPLYAEASSGE